MNEQSTPSAPGGAAGALPKPVFTPGPSTPTGNPKSEIRNPNLVDAATQVNAPGAQPAKAATPNPGWWKVNGVKGMKADVARAVGNIAGIPAHWQAALQAEIAAHDAEAVSVSAHFMQQNPSTVSGQSAQQDQAKAAAGSPVPPQGRGLKGRILLHLDISPLDGYVGSA